MTERKSFSRSLRRAHAAWRRRQILEGTVRWLGVCLPGLAALLLVALLLPPTRPWSGVMAAVAGAWIAGTAAALLIRPWFRPMGPVPYALWLEQRAGLPRNELINALDLERDAARWEDDALSRELVHRSIDRGAGKLEGLPLGRLHTEARLVPALGRAGAAVACAVLVFVLWPVRFTDALDLFLSAGSPSVIPVIEIAVEPGDLKVERGASVQIRAEVSGRRRPPSARVEMRRPGREWIEAEMVAEEAPAGTQRDTYGFVASGLKSDVDYRVRSGWAESETHRIRVLERLQALGYRKLYQPPAYTGLPDQREISSTGDLAALAGSDVTLEVRHRRPGARGRLLFSGAARPLPLKATGEDRLEATWRLQKDRAYVVELADAAEGDLWVSDTFRVEVIPDHDPAVRLIRPGENIVMPPDMHVTLVADCVDDFGMTELALIYGRDDDDPTRVVLSSWSGEKEARITHNWNLEEVQILPGQEVHYYLQVLDNDPIRGPKVGETGLFTIRFPTMAEMYASMEEERQEDAVTLEEALETQDELRDDLKEIAQEMLREENISWERQQEIEDLLERQEQLAEKVDDLQESLEQSRQRMENQSLFSIEMIDKVREIQQLAGEIQSEEFRQLLERMHDAIQNMDRRELQQAMEQMKITQEEISQALDRTLQMLRQLMAEEKLDRLMQKAEEMASRQEEINKQLEMGEAADSTGGGEKPLSEDEAADLARQQEQLRRELEELREQIAGLQKECEGQKGLEQLSDALKQQQQDPSPQDAKQQMAEAQQAMEKKDRRASLKFGRKAKQALQQMQSNLASLKQEVDLEKQEALARALYNIAHRMVTASQEQEVVVTAAARTGPRELAVREQELYDEVRTVGDSLLAVAGETPYVTREHLRVLAKALREIGQARDQLEAGHRQSAVSLAGESTRSLNAATMKLLNAANQQAMSSCPSSCPNPFNRMQSLTSQQCQLNMQMQQMMGQCNTPRLTPGEGESLARMAARQEMIRQGLEEVRQECQGSGKVMHELGEAVKEMEELVNQLRQRKADRRIIERQEKILSRMLSAQRSIRKRDESEERQSRVGVNPDGRRSPDPVDPGASPAEVLQRAMLRGSQDPVPPEYRGMVERYMRSLLRDRR